MWALHAAYANGHALHDVHGMGKVCVQGLAIPAPLKELYKTVWEIKQRILVDMAADRGAFIDQSQSFNVHMSDPNFGKLTSLHFYAWKARGPAKFAPSRASFHPVACCW